MDRTPSHFHKPVLCNQVVNALNPQKGEIAVDATFGAGGYSMALLDTPIEKLYGIDLDPEAVMIGQRLSRQTNGRFKVLSGNFSMMDKLLDQPLAEMGRLKVDCIAMDLGVSSMQIDQAERGFSFKQDGPLDMRMSQQGQSAADIVNTASEGELADLFSTYGEEPRSKRIARSIIQKRKIRPIQRTLELARIIRSIYSDRRSKKDPATRVFQALRIAVNTELKSLRKGLAAAERILSAGGRIAIVTFHSLEDRIVKQFFKERTHSFHPEEGYITSGSRHRPEPKPATDTTLIGPSFLNPAKIIRPGAEELADNPRARSAKLRSAVRTEAKPHQPSIHAPR